MLCTTDVSLDDWEGLESIDGAGQRTTTASRGAKPLTRPHTIQNALASIRYAIVLDDISSLYESCHVSAITQALNVLSSVACRA